MIKIELTETQARGFNLAGTAPDDHDAIAGQIELLLTVGGMDQPTAEFMAAKLAKGAREARAIIREATRYEIKVVTPPKPSTLLKKPKKTK
jgi:hypothetical protein